MWHYQSNIKAILQWSQINKALRQIENDNLAERITSDNKRCET